MFNCEQAMLPALLKGQLSKALQGYLFDVTEHEFVLWDDDKPVQQTIGQDRLWLVERNVITAVDNQHRRHDHQQLEATFQPQRRPTVSAGESARRRVLYLMATPQNSSSFPREPPVKRATRTASRCSPFLRQRCRSVAMQLLTDFAPPRSS